MSLAGAVQPLDLVDLFLNFKTLKIVEFRLMALEFIVKFVLWCFSFLLFSFRCIFVLLKYESE